VSSPPFEVLEHTADVGLRVHGRSLPELFANAGLGLMELAVEEQSIQPKERLTLAASGADNEELLVNWLSEILYFVDAEGWLFCRFSVNKMEDHGLQGEGWGQRRDPASRSRAVAVKAVTYHQVSVSRVGAGWEAVVYFDI
jgi:SHS2 domain-containing protein